MPSLAIIIVSWNVRDLLHRCLQTLIASLDATTISYEVVVVDNASHDDTVAMIRANFPQVHVLEPGENLGFAGGNNLVLRSLYEGVQQHAPAQWAKKSTNLVGAHGNAPLHHQPDFVLLLNPDTVPAQDAIPTLVHYLHTHPDVVAVGPQLRYADGTIQSSRRRFPQKQTFFWESTLLERLWATNPWTARYRCTNHDDEHEQQVDWLVGATLLVRSDAITRGGLLDEGFFMYSEELEWQYRLRGKIIYLPDAVVTHYEGKSSEQVPAARHIHFQRSKMRLARLWYGPHFALGLLLFLLLTYVWELALEGAKYLVGHRRSLRVQRMQTYVEVIRQLASSKGACSPAVTREHAPLL